MTETLDRFFPDFVGKYVCSAGMRQKPSNE